MLQLQYRFLSAVLCVGVLLSTGCVLFSPGRKAGDQNLLPKGTGNSYTVLLKGSKPATKEITEGMTVQDVLESSGATKRFGKMHVVIKRVIPGKQIRHKLPIDYEVKKRRVSYDQNYAIHPNDIVLVAPDKTTQLDKMVDALAGVLGH